METLQKYKLNSYEAICEIFSVSWMISIDKAFEADEIKQALVKTHMEHPFLRCKVTLPKKEDPSYVILEDDHRPNPLVEIIEDSLSQNDLKEAYIAFSREYSNKPHVETAAYKVYTDKKNNVTSVIGAFDHSCCDALSSLQVANTFMQYLSDPTRVPVQREWKSVQGEVVTPENQGTNYYDSIKCDFYSPPKSLYEMDCSVAHFRSQVCLINNEELTTILAKCHEKGVTFQGLLWLSAALSYMKMCNIPLGKVFRFQTPATAIGRVPFHKTIEKEDLVCGAAAIYVNQEIDGSDLFWDVSKKLTTNLHEELENGVQMNDFFEILKCNDFNCLPPYSMTACTLGVSCLKDYYSAANSFHLKDICFLGLTKIFPGVAGINIHSFTVPNLGCYMNCSYVYPGFSNEEAEKYVTGIRSIMLEACKNEQLHLSEF